MLDWDPWHFRAQDLNEDMLRRLHKMRIEDLDTWKVVSEKEKARLDLLSAKVNYRVKRKDILKDKLKAAERTYKDAKLRDKECEKRRKIEIKERYDRRFSDNFRANKKCTPTTNNPCAVDVQSAGYDEDPVIDAILVPLSDLIPVPPFQYRSDANIGPTLLDVVEMKIRYLPGGASDYRENCEPRVNVSAT
ncbi:hypothetical protein EVAR_83771_1 [Eumeta japonica]|uniref:Uncharacterized protein n=1 Tax=Eumeta variegata TaxID=151549 RepID=A0A4C1WH32_EUMVA|nr:hypothetical protein EVAR_83771_1 [Eumeta japonica]